MGPFQQATTAAMNDSISVSGPMSFMPMMHGMASQPSFSTFNDSQQYSYMDTSSNTALKIEEMQAKLNKRLGPEYISQRPGPGGGPKLTYAEGWKIINLANEVFGFNGWSTNIVNLTTDYIDMNESTGRYNVGVTAIVKVVLRDGVFHEDIGYGLVENQKSKGQALDKCKKEAVTDAVKRALRNFGNVLGNCLYDKQYASEVVKIKVPPAKFDKDDLHRRPEFTDTKPPIASTSTSNAPQTSSKQQAPPVKNEHSASSHHSNPAQPPKNNAVTETKPKISTNSHPPPPQTRPQQQNDGKPRKSTHEAVVRAMQATAAQAQAQQNQNETKPKTSVPPPPDQGQASTSHAHLPPHAQAHPQQPKSVSFAQPPTAPAPAAAADDDDEYRMNSSDDALFNNIDLDNLDVDIDRPIATEYTSTTEEEDDSANAMETASVADSGYAGSGNMVPAAKGGPVQQPQGQKYFGNESGNAAAGRPGQGTGGPYGQPQYRQTDGQRQQQPNPARPQQHQYSSSRPQPQQNHPPPENPVPDYTTSAGGFVFPPGKTYEDFQDKNPFTSRSRTPVGNNSVNAGVKRSNDVMRQQQQSMSRRSGPGPGMGLAVPGAQQGRQPLGTLSLSASGSGHGDGGDLKRVRR